MITDKQIEEAQESIFEDKFLTNGEDIIYTDDEGNEDYKEEMYDAGQIKEAIGLGAHWAIEQFLKGLWHDVSEKPTKKGFILVEYKPCDRYFYEVYHVGVRYDYKVICALSETLSRWLYIEDLLPKQKGDKDYERI